MASNEDPFLQVQQDVLSQLASTRPLFESYLRIRSLAKPSSATPSPELAAARTDLESALESLAEDLADLVESVRAVQHNPQQYGLSVAEVQRRQRVVQEAGDEVGKMRRELKNAALGTPGTPGLPDPNSFAIDGDNDNDDNYEQFEREQQLQMMHDQEEHLEGVFQTVGNLRQQANDMGRELEEQREMLEVADDLADRVDSRLKVGMHKLNTIIRRNEDRWSGCCIGVLIMVLIILLVLLLIL
ncbi:snare domain-containing protein [Ophiostoma piceae UAMH 11346]|uniref:t-SNARE affecting a late Golgi compartment protein 1 n=1 Tax=Ophiostoma piceae (strain UAMH 11346) TaxID=1262450 RepID=S3BVU3_OPHP1|nr:snare domain-containing protein [Ophiostoma piceae UAMH 11346]